MTIEPLLRTADSAFPSADPSVVTGLHARRGQELWGFARRLGLSDEEASDAVQETLVRLWTELRRGTAIDSPDAWAFRTLYRLAMDQHRLARRIGRLVERLGPARVTAPGPRDPSASAERIAVWAEVERLPAQQRHVVYLRYRADLPYEEIGRVLGITASAARSHAAQALATLRQRLAATGG